LFGSDTEYYAGVGSSPALEPENFFNSIYSGIIAAARDENESIPKNIILAANAGYEVYVEQYQEYGSSEYVFPTPESFKTEIIYPPNIEQKVAARIKEELVDRGFDPSIEIQSVRVKWGRPTLYTGSLPNNFRTDFAYAYLEKNLEVSSATINNRWHQNLTDFTARYAPIFSTGGLVDKDVSNPPILDSQVNPDWSIDQKSAAYETLHIAFETNDPSDNPGALVIIYNGLPLPPGNIYAVTYEIKDEFAFGSLERHWVYDPTTNTYPEIVAPTIDKNLNRTYAPIAFFLRDDIPWDFNKDNAWYKTQVELFDKLGLDADQIWGSFKEVLAQEGGDTNLTDMFFHFGCPVAIELPSKVTRAVQDYLFNFFKREIEESSNGELLVVGDQYDCLITWTALVLDSYGSPPSNYLNWESSARQVDKETGRTQFAFSCWKYDYQERLYKRIRVAGFEQNYLVNTRGGGRLAWVSSFDNLNVFFDTSLIGDLKITDKERAIQACVRGTVLVVEKVEIPWYQSSFFKVIFAVIVIVAAVFLQQWQLVGSFVTVFGISITYKLLVVTAFGFLLSIGVAFVYGDSPFGLALMLIVGIIFAGGVTNFFARFSLSNIINQGFGTAIQALNTVTTIVKHFYKYYLENELRALQQELEDLTKTYQERMEELESAYYSLVQDKAYIDPLGLGREAERLLFESPDDFINRTKQTNPGSSMLDLPSNFVDLCLEKPTKVNIENPLTEIMKMISGERRQ